VLKASTTAQNTPPTIAPQQADRRPSRTLEDCSVSWLYGQTWLWYLIAFVAGLLLARLVLVRPQERRLKALLLRSAAANRSRPTGAGAAGASTASAPADPTEALPRSVVDPAGATASVPTAVENPVDAPTDVFPAVNPALSTLDATLVVAEAETPPEGLAIVPPPDDTATPPEGIPAACGERSENDLIPDEPLPDEPSADEPDADDAVPGRVTAEGTTEVEEAPTTARLRREKTTSDQPAVGDAPEAR
jgi:hypothetical protein